MATYRALFPSARIYAFEPHPDSFCTLNSRFSRDPEVIPIACALSDRSSPRTLHVSKHHAAHSLLPRPRRGPKYFGHSADMVAQVSVESTSIDEFRREQGLSGRPIDILKMDIQGGERAGLEGARGTLARGAVSLVYTESIFVPHYEGGPLYHHIASQLEEFGYTLFGLYNFVHAENGQLRFGDAIFLSPSLRERVDGRLAEAR